MHPISTLIGSSTMIRECSSLENRLIHRADSFSVIKALVVSLKAGCIREALSEIPVSALLDKIDRHNNSLLHIAAMEGNDEVLSLLLEFYSKSLSPYSFHGAINAINENLETPLHLAIRNKNNLVINTLLKYHANPTQIDINGHTAYDLAKKFSIDLHALAVSRTLSYPVDSCSSKDDCLSIASLIYTPFQSSDAISMKRFSVVYNDSRRQMPRENQKSITAIMEAAKESSTKLKELLSKGFNIDTQTTKGTTALMLAAQKGYCKAVKRLLNNGASTSITNHRKRTALNIAIRKLTSFPNLASKIQSSDTIQTYFRITKKLARRDRSVALYPDNLNVTPLQLAKSYKLEDIETILEGKELMKNSIPQATPSKITPLERRIQKILKNRIISAQSNGLPVIPSPQSIARTRTSRDLMRACKKGDTQYLEKWITPENVNLHHKSTTLLQLVTQSGVVHQVNGI